MVRGLGLGLGSERLKGDVGEGGGIWFQEDVTKGIKYESISWSRCVVVV